MFKKLLRIFPPKLWWIGVLSIFFMAAAFYLILNQGFKQASINEYLEHEKTLSRAIAANFETFFDVVGKSTVFRAQLIDNVPWDTETQEIMDAFVDLWRESNLIAGIILADDEGIVKSNANVMNSTDVGASVADRDYFVWAKNESKQRQYMVGQPVVSRLGASKGELIVPVASPIFIDGNFVGVLTTATNFLPLTRRFMEKMKVSEPTDIFLVNSQKEVLYASSGSPDLDDNIIRSLDTNQDKFPFRQNLIAYSRVNLGNQQWFVIVSSPYKQVYAQGLPFYIRQVAVLMIVSLTTLGFGVIVSIENQNKLK